MDALVNKARVFKIVDASVAIEYLKRVLSIELLFNKKPYEVVVAFKDSMENHATVVDCKIKPAFEILQLELQRKGYTFDIRYNAGGIFCEDAIFEWCMICQKIKKNKKGE